jgi:glycine/D-amino acid oxidase-like deaminating enzyme
MRVLICGGGAIGTSIAYFLAARGAEPVVIERHEVAGAASGKSGGFLALDWCDGSPLGPLARRSFALHAELPESLGIDWGYRRLDTLGVVASARRDVSRYRRVESPGWLSEAAAVHGRLGGPSSTAQVDPGGFTRGMMEAAGARGGLLLRGTVEGIALSADGATAIGVKVDGRTVEGDAMVIAMGPWSVLACRWLPLPAVYGLKGNSLLFRYAPPETAALFVELESDGQGVDTPEVFPRPDGTTYVCGLSGQAALPLDPADVAPDAGAPERLRAMTARYAPGLAAAEILAARACYRPVTEDGLPLMGRVPGVAGAYVATGHSVWGMLNAPATGEAMAALIAGDATGPVDLSAFDPARLSPVPASP